MLLQGTVVVDEETVRHDGAVVVDGDRIAAVGDATTLRERYPDRERLSFDVIAPGLVGAHVHSVQSLGRGVADDVSLLSWLYDAVLPMEAELDAEGVRVAAALGYLELLASGTTTVVDHLTVHHAEEAFAAAGDLGIRGVLGKVLMDQESPAGLEEDTDAALAESRRLVDRFHRSHDDRLRYAVTPRFDVTCSEACLRGARDVADAHDDVRIHTHAAERPPKGVDPADGDRVDAEDAPETDTETGGVRWLHEVGLTGEDVVLAHCVHTTEAERELLVETGTNVCHCPSANMKIGSGVAPVAEYRDRGITVALGNDGPPCNNALDEFTELRQAALLQSVAARDPTALSAAAAFEMATTEGATAAGFDRLGELREGWRADVVGLDADHARATPLHDVVSHLVYAAHGDDVRFTMVGGDVVYRDGDLVAADRTAAEIRERAAEYAAGLDALPDRPHANG
ncbi:MAG: 5'-deoxyadenosine deaminase [Halolamina sp.]